MNDSSDYLQEVGSFKVLTPTENAVLARRKTPEALEELINANLRLVVYWAKRFHAVTGMDLDDLIQEGNLGLIVAAKRFNPRKGMFSTTASWWIKSKIRRYICEKRDLVQGPGWHLRAMIRNWKKVAAALEQELGKPPTVKEVQAKVRLSKRHLVTVKIALSLGNAFKGRKRADGTKAREYDDAGIPAKGQQTGVISLCQPHNFNVEASVRENLFQLPDKRMENIPGHLYAGEATMTELRRALSSIPFILEGKNAFKEMQVFDRRLIKGQTLEQIGQAMGITRERVRQIEAEVLRKMREFLKGKNADLLRNEVELERERQGR